MAFNRVGARFTQGDIEPHMRYLATVPREVVRRRLEYFRLREEVMDVPPIICLLGEISDKYAEWRPWLHPLDPVSLDDLKNWFGVPNEVARLQMSATRTLTDGGNVGGRLTRVRIRHLPMRREYEFHALDAEQRVAVKDMATQLLYGYVDPDEVARPPIAGVVEYMLRRTKATNPRIFVAPDLIVCPDDEIVFKNIPALLFNNVLVYGNGQITTASHTKIHAHQIHHVD